MFHLNATNLQNGRFLASSSDVESRLNGAWFKLGNNMRPLIGERLCTLQYLDTSLDTSHQPLKMRKALMIQGVLSDPSTNGEPDIQNAQLAT